jgi:hypothetical protein
LKLPGKRFRFNSSKAFQKCGVPRRMRHTEITLLTVWAGMPGRLGFLRATGFTGTICRPNLKRQLDLGRRKQNADSTNTQFHGRLFGLAHTKCLFGLCGLSISAMQQIMGLLDAGVGNYQVNGIPGFRILSTC